MARKPYTYNQLMSYLEDDFAWRRKELKIIKDQIPNKSGPKQSAALRFAVPILYAHWEGFVKKSCELYLEYVAKQHLKHNELKPQFIALSLSKKLGNLEIKNLVEKSKTVEFLLGALDENSNILTRDVIKTRSNLRYSVLEEILFVVGIDETKFRPKKSLINDLVDSRNNIAHGDYLRVAFDTYEILHEDTQALMKSLKIEIENSATLKSFKITPPSPPDNNAPTQT